MPKSTIRPPRRPAKEDPAVTIANQSRQIDNLVERIQIVVKERDEAMRLHRLALDGLADNRRKIAELERDLSNRMLRLNNLSSSHERMLGWQDCAREVFNTLGDK